MGQISSIEWTDATWNPVTGCSKVSPGCAHCYAETLSLRRGWSAQPWNPANAVDNVILHEDRLDAPLRWRASKRIFVNSMSDLFHEQVSDDFLARVFTTMLTASHHVYQVLTKRPERMRDFINNSALRDRLPQSPWIWLGTSVENQRWARDRIPLLLATSSSVRFLSCEPLLGPVDLQTWLPLPDKFGHCQLCGGVARTGVRHECPSRVARLHWVISGGESGLGYRPIDPVWVRSLRDQCQAAGVAFFHKQWGGRTPKAGGRDLDGRTWDEFPTAQIVTTRAS